MPRESVAQYYRNLELKKNIPNSERTNLFNLPDITPEEFIKVMDMMLKRMIKNR